MLAIHRRVRTNIWSLQLICLYKPRQTDTHAVRFRYVDENKTKPSTDQYENHHI